MIEEKKNIYNIVLIDDHPVLWEGVTLLLEQDKRLKVIAAAADGTEIIRTAAIKQCDIMILDITLPLMDGFSVIQKVSQDYPKIDFLIFTMHANLELFNRCMGMGVKGYILKRDPPVTLLHAVQNIIAGNLAISPSISPMLTGVDQGKALDEDEALKELTGREMEVLSLVAAGMTSREIARSLNIKKSTVDKHREHIRNKLGTARFTELLYFARKSRLF